MTRTRLGDPDCRADRCSHAVAAYDEVLAGKPGATAERKARLGKAECGRKRATAGAAKRFVAREPQNADARELAGRLAEVE